MKNIIEDQELQGALSVGGQALRMLKDRETTERKYREDATQETLRMVERCMRRLYGDQCAGVQLKLPVGHLVYKNRDLVLLTFGKSGAHDEYSAFDATLVERVWALNALPDLVDKMRDLSELDAKAEASGEE